MTRQAEPAAARSTPSAREAASALIAARGGRVTRTRVAVLDVLLAADHPLSHDEIGATLAAQGRAHDRVTLYRALDWLVEQGIARRMAGSDRAWRFEAVRAEGHRHAHFHCERCGHVLCLEGLTPAFALALPEGYELERAELVFHGACPDCGGKRLAPPGAAAPPRR